ncbi:2',5' RNA ligase family [Pseudobythopirellula maris]|uniref:RNA 2',3'-cyclic phosphodiesterase n=1 Tax=Pseudobythopirellula maris TaxID=2527991 RepID=A0A5C5ZKC8_9BACT|nr:RNA 2',3'-cyclic phosphodiesterase [Pseudobythopirellula maris]TWT87588.1 2',5' RNA ligase family [Pseudobythopirellula maris]
MGKTRTFVAVEIAEEVQRRASQLIQRLTPHAPRARWVEEENLHVTLLFLGDLTDHEVADACSRVEWVARANEPFGLTIEGAGAFPAPDRPQTLWLGVGEGRAELERLHDDLDADLGDLVVKPERRGYVPHLTLARLNKAANVSGHLGAALTGLADYNAGDSMIDGLTVFASELDRSGPTYHALAHCPLGTPG